MLVCKTVAFEDENEGMVTQETVLIDQGEVIGYNVDELSIPYIGPRAIFPFNCCVLAYNDNLASITVALAGIEDRSNLSSDINSHSVPPQVHCTAPNSVEFESGERYAGLSPKEIS